MSDFCGALDYCGIIGMICGPFDETKWLTWISKVLIVGSFVPCLYYGFYCDTLYQIIYVAGVTFGGIGK